MEKDDIENPLVARARELALEAHGGQRYGSHPYHVHLDAVAELARKYGEEAQVLAYLHDVVEDTPVELGAIAEAFGQRIAECVAILTDEPGASREERKKRTYARMAGVSGDLELALVVKAADRLANMRACVADGKDELLGVYKREHASFRESAYRQDLCEDLWYEMGEICASARPSPARRSLLFGGLCAGVGLLFGIFVALGAEGDGYRWFFVAAALAAFVSGTALWRVLPERIPRHRLAWGALAGALAGLVSHYLTWYLAFVGANVCFWLTGGCTSSLGEPPANLLEAFAGAAGFTFFSLLIVGWLTVPIGAGLGLAFGFASTPNRNAEAETA